MSQIYIQYHAQSLRKQEVPVFALENLITMDPKKTFSYHNLSHSFG